MTGATPPIDVALVRRLVAAQFPDWAGLRVRPVPVSGWDNRTFRLGEELTVRLPSAPPYVPQVAKEQRWLPVLARELPLPVPTPVAQGAPALGYPHPWSVLRWVDGETAAAAPPPDMGAFARDVAAFLRALQGVDAAGGPAAGEHNFWRGGPLEVYEAEVVHAIEALSGAIDDAAARVAWTAARASSWGRAPVWVHGDVAVGNLLVAGGRLAGVIDFGSSGVGDPACDLVLAWTLFDAPVRAVFREALAVDPGTWARGRGWALWKALITLAAPDGGGAHGAGARRTLEAALADHAGRPGA